MARLNRTGPKGPDERNTDPPASPNHADNRPTGERSARPGPNPLFSDQRAAWLPRQRRSALTSTNGPPSRHAPPQTTPMEARTTRPPVAPTGRCGALPCPDHPQEAATTATINPSRPSPHSGAPSAFPTGSPAFPPPSLYPTRIGSNACSDAAPVANAPTPATMHHRPYSWPRRRSAPQNPFPTPDAGRPVHRRRRRSRPQHRNDRQEHEGRPLLRESHIADRAMKGSNFPHQPDSTPPKTSKSPRQ